MLTLRPFVSRPRQLSCLCCCRLSPCGECSSPSETALVFSRPQSATRRRCLNRCNKCLHVYIDQTRLYKTALNLFEKVG
jgi:hypothetical protein